MACRFSTSRVQDYLDGRGTASQREATGEHLAVCPTCARTAEEHRRLKQLLVRLPAREVSPGFEPAVVNRVAASPEPSSLRAWWERLRHRLSWRLAPAIVAAGAVAAGLMTWALLPPPAQPVAGPGPAAPPSVRFVQQCVDQHRVLVDKRKYVEVVSDVPDSDLDAVEASINVSAGLNLTE